MKKDKEDSIVTHVGQGLGPNTERKELDSERQELEPSIQGGGLSSDVNGGGLVMDTV